MPLYNYEVRAKDGKKVTAIRDAVNREVLIDSLQKEGYIVLSVKIASKAKDIKLKLHFTHSGVRTSDLVVFSRQLGVMLDAGVTLNRALDAILKQTSSKSFFNILTQVRIQVVGGSALAQALSKFPRVFSPLWVSMIETGEASGKLNFVLTRLSRYLEIKLNFKSTIITSLYYPVVLLVAAIGALVLFMLKIIPTLSQLFESFSMELPFITQMTINASDFLRANILFIFLGFILIVVAAWQIQKIGVINRRLWKILFSLPLFGNLLRVLVVERFLSQMGILVESGVPMLHSLEISQRSAGNPVLKEIINSVKHSVKSGSTLTRPMESSGFFAPIVIQMVNAGEESGNLAMMLEKVSSFYEEYTRTFLDRFSRLFEPLMIVIMGVFVGVLVISMYMPIFQIATLGGGALK